MNKVTRMLAMAGLSLAATAMIGAGAASAASAATATPSGDKSASAVSNDRFGGKTRIIGYYRNALTCHRIGNAGEWRRQWDDHECYRVRSAFHRGSWVLVAKWDRHFGGPGHFNNGPGHINNGGPGHFNNGGPGHFNNGGPGHFNNGPWDQKKR